MLSCIFMTVYLIGMIKMIQRYSKSELSAHTLTQPATVKYNLDYGDIYKPPSTLHSLLSQRSVILIWRCL